MTERENMRRRFAWIAQFLWLQKPWNCFSRLIFPFSYHFSGCLLSLSHFLDSSLKVCFWRLANDGGLLTVDGTTKQPSTCMRTMQMDAGLYIINQLSFLRMNEWVRQSICLSVSFCICLSVYRALLSKGCVVHHRLLNFSTFHNELAKCGARH